MTDFLRTNYRLTGGHPDDSEIQSYWYYGNVTDSFTGGSYATAIATLIGYTTSVTLFRARYYWGETSTGAAGPIGQPTASYVPVVYATVSNAMSYLNIKARWLWERTSAAAADTMLYGALTTSVSAMCVLWDALVCSH